LKGTLRYPYVFDVATNEAFVNKLFTVAKTDPRAFVEILKGPFKYAVDTKGKDDYGHFYPNTLTQR